VEEIIFLKKVTMENKDNKNIYIIGIEGAGTSALAQIYKAMGYSVMGSDNGDHFYQNLLKDKKIKVFSSFDKNNLPENIDFAVYSTAFKENNPEIIEIKKRGVALYSYPQALGDLFNGKIGIAVCGTHGKTTTTALLASILQNAKLSPTALVGSNVVDWNTNMLIGEGDYFVAETDEYQNKLKYYNPWSVILTSVDWDHPDFFPNFSDYKKVFEDFIIKIPKTGYLIVWGDSTDTLEVAQKANCRVLTYGFNEKCDYKISSLSIQNKTDAGDKFINFEKKQNTTIQSFEIEYAGEKLGVFETSLVGKHNALNCAATVALCHKMKLDFEVVKKSLREFEGTSRRFERVGKFEEAVLIDDYAHHPDEIKATLSGAREIFPDKTIWTVFHPHTFTRTKALLQEFSQSFDAVNISIIIDIYGSAREQQGGVSSKDLVNLINKYFPGKAEYIPTIDEAVQYLKEKSGQYDVLITMGAGDVWKIAEQLKTI
jgi:UDP-N-acetylmuramate--alanine ligase